ncbi:hypothetical protein MTR67_036229, partial [Solanum verrucosum]
KKCEKNFQKLKTFLTITSIIALPVEGKDFRVYCDASHSGLDAVLMQDKNVIAYASRLGMGIRLFGLVSGFIFQFFQFLILVQRVSNIKPNYFGSVFFILVRFMLFRFGLIFVSSIFLLWVCLVGL